LILKVCNIWPTYNNHNFNFYTKYCHIPTRPTHPARPTRPTRSMCERCACGTLCLWSLEMFFFFYSFSSSISSSSFSPFTILSLVRWKSSLCENSAIKPKKKQPHRRFSSTNVDALNFSINRFYIPYTFFSS
jgi:hypothetical protein